jgi:glutamine synthetase
MDLASFQTLRVAATDLNGQMRGKRVPGSYAPKLADGVVRMPFSALNVDIFGYDIDDSPLVFESGDADGLLLPSDRGAMPTPWLSTPQPFVPMEMFHEDGRPFEVDARHALKAVLSRYDARGWRVVAATELEFTLVDDSGDALQIVKNPQTGRRVQTAAVLSLAQLDAFDAFFSELYAACDSMGIPAQTTTSESGYGQFEITLNHQSALRAADDTWIMKALIKGLARKHGFAATFMAKPFEDDTGNGLHMHFSVLDKTGRNVFDNGGEEGTEVMRHAVAGCLAAMPASTLIFAPHANSYRRLVPGQHAPTAVCWGYDNRTVACRIPSGAYAARRIEHRVAGGDINPYLTFAAVLGAAMTGIDEKMEPPAPMIGNAYDQPCPQLAPDWENAIDRFEKDPLIATIFSPMLIRYLVLTKRQELRLMADQPVEEHWKTYINTV